MKRTKYIRNFYHMLVTLPDSLYPFRNEIQGRWVRGRRSYEKAVMRAFNLHGNGKYGYRLSLYRSTFHVFGALIIIFGAAFLSQRFLGNAAALYVVLALTVVFITYQEFYLQRRLYRQLWRKGILDWFTWIVPIGLYFFTHIR